MLLVVSPARPAASFLLCKENMLDISFKRRTDIDGLRAWQDLMAKRIRVDALCACDTIPCRMEVMDDIIRKFPGTDGRKMLWAAAVGLPTEGDREAFISELKR